MKQNLNTKKLTYSPGWRWSIATRRPFPWLDFCRSSRIRIYIYRKYVKRYTFRNTTQHNPSAAQSKPCKRNVTQENSWYDDIARSNYSVCFYGCVYVCECVCFKSAATLEWIYVCLCTRSRTHSQIEAYVENRKLCEWMTRTVLSQHKAEEKHNTNFLPLSHTPLLPCLVCSSWGVLLRIVVLCIKRKGQGAGRREECANSTKSRNQQRLQ